MQKGSTKCTLHKTKVSYYNEEFMLFDTKTCGYCGNSLCSLRMLITLLLLISANSKVFNSCEMLILPLNVVWFCTGATRSKKVESLHHRDILRGSYI